jgi:hypothetical protein
VIIDPNAHFSGSDILFFDPGKEGYDTAYLKAALHEIGHTMGLGEMPTPTGGVCAQTNGATVMNGFCGTNDMGGGSTPGGNLPTAPSTCDNDVLHSGYISQAGNSCDPAIRDNCLSLGGATWEDYPACRCSDPSPILIDTLGNGFELTKRSGGVYFDINNDGTRELLPWTSGNSDDAWLVLDRDGDSLIDSGAELFGNFTPQSPSTNRNGFTALAEYDKFENGGNGMV